MDKNRFKSDLNMDPRLTGAGACLSPFLANISSQRGKMFIGNLSQAMVIHGNETARIQSGYETKYGKYCIDPAWREHDVQILDIIPKFAQISNEKGPIHNPSMTIIYKDVESPDGEIGYFTVPDYVMLHSKFGYFTKKTNMHELRPDGFIPKDMKFVQAPNHDDDLYNLGANANTVYMPLWGTTNDAFIISDEFAKKLEHTEIGQVTVQIGANYIPLNLYGDDNNYKSFPDIGETVRDDGIIFAMREHTADSLIADVTAESLRTPSIHDETYMAPAGAQIIDVNIFINKGRFNEVKQIGTYSQFSKYQDSMNAYYNAIINAYNKYMREGYKISPQFASLVVQAKSRCYNGEYRDLVLYCKKEPIDLIYITITYASTHGVAKGYKITSRDGAKGVISDIWKKEDMPAYQCGSKTIHADLVVTGESPFNRLNTSQLYEQFINYASDIVVQRCVDGLIGDDEAQFTYLLKFMGLIRPIYAELIIEMVGTTPVSRSAWVKEVREKGLYYIIPPFTKTISPQMIRAISTEFDIHESPIWYHQYDGNGNRYRVDCKDKGIIGSKYIMLLGKLPLDALSAIEFGYVSQFNLPVKSTSNDIKQQSLFGRTPCRYGEDETAILTMSLGAMTTARLLGLYSNCLTAQELLKKHLLTDPYPTRLEHIEMTDQEVVQQSINIKISSHLFAASGYQLVQDDVEIANQAQGTLTKEIA